MARQRADTMEAKVEAKHSQISSDGYVSQMAPWTLVRTFAGTGILKLITILLARFFTRGII